jgi:hypothetical protein
MLPAERVAVKLLLPLYSLHNAPMNRRGIKPRFRIGFDRPTGSHGYRRSLPFRRSWLAISVLAVFDAIFLIPLIITFRQAFSGWTTYDSLFDLVMAVFLSAWMLGWATAPIILTTILLLLVFGKEVIRARPGVVELFTGIPLIGLITTYDVTKMRNLRLEEAQKKGGNSWRGTHMVFDYGANPVSFGSAVSSEMQSEIESGIASSSGSLIGKGPARPEDLQTAWEPEETVKPAAAPLHEAVIEAEPVSWTSPSSIALIIANLVPVAGAAFLGWSLGDVMVLYWAESAVIGFFNLLKIIVIGRWGALLYGPFFVGHFGGFMAVHFLFIYSLFVVGIHNQPDVSGDLSRVAKLFIALWPALAALFISHAYSFFVNFLGREEYLGKTVSDQMTEPYSRIIFMHLVLIFGGGLTLFLNSATPVLLAVIAIKIYVDLKSHLRERAGKRPAKKKK